MCKKSLGSRGFTADLMVVGVGYVHHALLLTPGHAQRVLQSNFPTLSVLVPKSKEVQWVNGPSHNSF